jgi:ubiquinone/menaquinone biosynthesis C-methylase UbiE
MDNWYERNILPHLLDFACGLKPMRRQRDKVVPHARGVVLEIGIGTGLNLPHYKPEQIVSLTGLDPSMQMHPKALKRLSRTGLKLTLLPVGAEGIPLPDASVDTVVMTYTLCTIPEPLQALTEIRRVLKADGKLLFTEHARAPDASVRKWQDRLQPVWGKLAGGCHLGRDIQGLLEQAGFHFTQIDMRYLPGPRPFTFNVWGEAYRSDESQA